MKQIKLLVIDVDGTMTDGGIYYDEHGNEWKKFNTKDAAGFFAAKRAGIKTMVLTGRECAATTRRMTELQVDYLFQNVRDKAAFLRDFMRENGLEKEDVGYIGDDEEIVENKREAKRFDTREEAERMRYIVATSVAELHAEVVEVKQ